MHTSGRSGGAVSISHTPTSLDHCTFYMNSAPAGPAVYNVGVISDSGPQAVMFASNFLACGDGEFIDYSEPSFSESSANAPSEVRVRFVGKVCSLVHLVGYRRKAMPSGFCVIAIPI